MDEGLRFTLNHLGDVVVGGLDRAWCAFTDVLTWRSYRLYRRRQEVLRRIGQRVSEIQGDSPDLEIFDDEILAELVMELRELEEDMAGATEEHAPEKAEGRQPEGEAAG